jgi:hypothetical protein
MNSVYIPNPISLRSILILSAYLHLGLLSGLFPSGFPTKSVTNCCCRTARINIANTRTCHWTWWCGSYIHLPSSQPVIRRTILKYIFIVWLTHMRGGVLLFIITAQSKTSSLVDCFCINLYITGVPTTRLTTRMRLSHVIDAACC